MAEEQELRILVADDDPISRKILEKMLKRWGCNFSSACDGDEAWEVISTQHPDLVLLDWMMPGIEGPELCRRIRLTETGGYTYIILLTIRDEVEDRVTGLQSGADDYIIKPYDANELRCRINTGMRIVKLERELGEKVRQLEESLAQIKQLHGLLPICSYCKKVRDDSNYWHQVETYVAEHSDVMFTHGICPDCYQKHVVPLMQKSTPPPDTEEE